MKIIRVKSDRVICDGSCGEDYTDSTVCGGILFSSYAICPACAPRWEDGARRNNEAHLIHARCPDDMTFADWVRELRG